MDWVLAFAVGLGTSLVELLSRYRDEPIKVIATSHFAWVYLLLNGFLAIFAHLALLDAGFAEDEIRAVMGGNALRVIRAGIAPLAGAAS